MSATPVAEETASSWTGRIRDRLLSALPPDRALPDQQPTYVSSWIYVFGVLAFAALVFIIVSVRPSPWAGSTGGTPPR